MAAFAALAPIMSLVSGFATMGAGVAQNNSEAEAQRANAALLRRQAEEEQKQGARMLATATRDAEAEGDKKDAAASRAQAVAAASGGGTINPTILNIMREIEGQGNYNAGMKTAAGLADQRHMMAKSDASNYQAAMADRRADEAKSKTVFTILGGMANAAGGMFKGGSDGNSTYKSTRYS